MMTSSRPRDARQVLRELGVPAESIRKIGGRNTFEEMRHLRDLLGPEERVGLITSGWHMPRAMRLARAAGLHVEPLPAGFAAGPVDFNLLAPIPTARGLW